MARHCTICLHPQLAAIESALLRGETEHGLARLFGVSHDAINRHKGEHMSAALATLGQERVEELGDTFDRIARSLTTKLAKRFDDFERDDQLKAALAVSDRLVPALGLLGRASQRFAQTNVSVLVLNEIGAPVSEARSAVESQRNVAAMVGDRPAMAAKFARWLVDYSAETGEPLAAIMARASGAEVVEGAQTNGNGVSVAEPPVTNGTGRGGP